MDGRTYGKGFFRSDDSGETWRKLSDEAPNEVCQIKGDAALIGYFAKDVLKRGVDGGRTFHPFTGCTLAQANHLSFDAHEPGLVVAGLADRSAAVSFDGGVHFAPIKGSEKVPSGCSSKILVDRKRLFYLTTGSGVYTRTLE